MALTCFIEIRVKYTLLFVLASHEIYWVRQLVEYRISVFFYKSFIDSGINTCIKKIAAGCVLARLRWPDINVHADTKCRVQVNSM